MHCAILWRYQVSGDIGTCHRIPSPKTRLPRRSVALQQLGKLQPFPLSQIAWFRKIIGIFYHSSRHVLQGCQQFCGKRYTRYTHCLWNGAKETSQFDLAGYDEQQVGLFQSTAATAATLSFWRSKPWSRKHLERLSTLAIWSGLCTQGHWGILVVGFCMTLLVLDYYLYWLHHRIWSDPHNHSWIFRSSLPKVTFVVGGGRKPGQTRPNASKFCVATVWIVWR